MKNILVIISDYHVSAQLLGERTLDQSMLFHKEILHEKEIPLEELISRIFVLVRQMVQAIKSHGHVDSLVVLLSGPFISEEVREIVYKAKLSVLVDQNLITQMKRQDAKRILQEDPEAYVVAVGVAGIFLNGFLKQNPLGVKAKEVVIKRIVAQADRDFLALIHKKIQTLCDDIEYVSPAVALLPVLARGGSTCCIVPHRHSTDIYMLNGRGDFQISSFQEGVFDIMKNVPSSLVDATLAHSAKLYDQKEVKKSHSFLYKKQILGAMQKRWLSHVKEAIQENFLHTGEYGEIFVVAPPQLSRELESLIEVNVQNMHSNFVVHQRDLLDVSGLVNFNSRSGGLRTLVSLFEGRHNGIDRQ
jgi:hypothetical protein